MKKKSIGDMPAFACGADGGCGPWPGMTYRQWLLGQALAGNLAYPGVGTGFSAEDAVRLSFVAVELAIEALDSQAKEDSCSKETHDQSEPATERKPLVDGVGDNFYFVVDTRGVLITAWRLSREDAEGDAKRLATKTGKSHTVCQVMAPESGECPTVPVATFTPERPHEWVIYLDSKSGEGSFFGLNGVVWFIDHKHHCVQRFATADEAQAYIDENEVADAYPWPVPKLTS